MSLKPTSAELFPEAARNAPIEAPKGMEARTFVGDGSSDINLGDCQKVDRVVIGGQDVPESIEEDYPTTASERPVMERVSIPLWIVIKVGVDHVLRRSIKSNDGVWQKGAEVVVVGKWGKAAPGKETAE